MSQQFIEGFKPSAEQLQEATLKWASDRGIIQNGKPITQVQKLASEVGELMDNIAKDRDIRDDVGDCIVVMVNVAGVLNLDISEAMEFIDGYDHNNHDKKIFATLDRGLESIDILIGLGLLARSIKGLYSNDHIAEYINELIISLGWVVSTYADFDLIDCWLHAYNDIKDRKGYLNENGNFIKEGDVE